MLKAVITILQMLCCIVLIIVVLLQKGTRDSLGAITGSSDSYVSKTKSRSIDDKLRKITIAMTVLFIITTVGLNILALANG
jgi:preprotein translocase subunit SecG